MSDTTPCSCDPTLDAPSNPHCPVHGEEIRAWKAWARGETRCPYCVGAAWEDFAAMCDCPQYEREDAAA